MRKVQPKSYCEQHGCRRAYHRDLVPDSTAQGSELVTPEFLSQRCRYKRGSLSAGFALGDGLQGHVERFRLHYKNRAAAARFGVRQGSFAASEAFCAGAIEIVKELFELGAIH